MSRLAATGFFAIQVIAPLVPPRSCMSSSA